MRFTAGCPAAAGREAITPLLTGSPWRRRSLRSAARQVVNGSQFVNAAGREVKA
jgi:hypothetical protein